MRARSAVLAVAVLGVLVTAGCGGGAGRDVGQTRTARPSATGTREPVVMSHAEAFQTALAVVPALRKDWTGASTGTVNRVSVCGDEPVDVPGLADGVYVEAGWAQRQDDAPTTRDVERLRAVVAAVPSGQRDRAVAGVHALASCDGASSSGAGRSPVTSAEVSGIEVVTLPTTYQQKAKPHTVHRVYTAEVVDGLAVLCVADGTSLERSREMATGCTTRGRESVDVIRGGPSARGSIASAAALAARLRPTKGQPVQANPVPVVEPCYGSTVRPPTAGVVSTKLETGEMGSVPALLVVQPFDDAASAQRELARYRGLTATCVGEYVLSKATASTPEYRVTRLRPQPTSSGDGGVRFPSFFGTAKKHTGTSQVVEVFAVGPHLVFAAGEAKDLEAATKLVEVAIADVLVPSRS